MHITIIKHGLLNEASPKWKFAKKHRKRTLRLRNKMLWSDGTQTELPGLSPKHHV